MENSTYGLDEKGIEILVRAIVSNFVKSNHFTSIQDLIKQLQVEMHDGDDLVVKQLTNPDNFPLSETENTISVKPVTEIGGIDKAAGDLVARDDAVRTVDFIPIIGGETYTFINGLGYKPCVYCYDANKAFMPKWNGDYSYRYVNDGSSITFPKSASYIKFYCSSTTDTTVPWEITSVQTVKTLAGFIKQYFPESGYIVSSEEFDPGLWELQMMSERDEFTIFSIKAPAVNPSEATIALKCTGDGTAQFADISCMRYRKNEQGQVCIICQKRGSTTPLPYFFIGFNDGSGAGRIQKLRVEPDAIPVQFTKDGIKVRRNNTYDNEWSAEETVVVNLADIYDKINALSTTVSTGTIVKASGIIGPTGVTCQYPAGFDRYNTLVVGNKIHRNIANVTDDEAETSLTFNTLQYRSNEIFCTFDDPNIESVVLYLQKVDPIQ